MKRGEATTEDNSQQLLLVASRRSSRGFNSTREETSQQGVKGANGDSWECLFLNQHSQDPRWKIEREFEANLEMNAAAGAEREIIRKEEERNNSKTGGGAGSARKRKDVVPMVTLSRADWEERLRMERLLKGMVRVLSGKLEDYEAVDPALRQEVDAILTSAATGDEQSTRTSDGDSRKKRARVDINNATSSGGGEEPGGNNGHDSDGDIMDVWGA